MVYWIELGMVVAKNVKMGWILEKVDIGSVLLHENDGFNKSAYINEIKRTDRTLIWKNYWQTTTKLI